MKDEENHVGLKLNGTYQLLAYAYEVKLLGDKMSIINRSTEM
jgi:hypothetical protein